MDLTPDVIIAGAPKCGSTSLFHWLSAHPGVCASSVKETYFLMDKGYPLYRAENSIHEHGLQGYGEFFDHCRADKQLLLEATPDYLYQKTALEVIASMPKSPITLFVLRKPSDRVYSLFQFARNNVSSLPKSIDFETFVNAVMEGGVHKFLSKRPILQQSIRHSQYVDYLEHWLSHLGENICLVLYEQLRDNPRELMISLSSRLDLDPGHFEGFNFTAKNKTYAVKHQSLHKAKRKLSQLMPNGSFRKSLRNVYYKLNTASSSKRSPEDIQALSMLDDHFSKFNDRLENLFAINLASWK